MVMEMNPALRQIKKKIIEVQRLESEIWSVHRGKLVFVYLQTVFFLCAAKL